jgi:phage repressor protein C with HTH and peptisase S24 domain
MEEVLFAGDTVYCHPYKPIRKNDLVVIQLWEDGPGGKIMSLVKRFVSEDDANIVLRQHNPPIDLTFEKFRVRATHRVVLIESA